MAVPHRRILAIDVGEVRVGLAIADTDNKLALPFKTLINSSSINSEIKAILESESIDLIVVGLPRNLNGEETSQTKYAREFGDSLGNLTSLELFMEDEALSSVRAKEILEMRGKSYKKEEVDSLAASYILEDFLVSHQDLFV